MATYVILIDVYMLPGYNYELLNLIIVWKLIRVWSSCNTHTVGGIVYRYNHKIKQKYQYSPLLKSHQYTHVKYINAVMITGANAVKSP